MIKAIMNRATQLFFVAIMCLCVYFFAWSIRFNVADFYSFVFYKGIYHGWSISAAEDFKDGNDEVKWIMIRHAFSGGPTSTEKAYNILRGIEYSRAGFGETSGIDAAAKLDFSESDEFLMDSLDHMTNIDLSVFLASQEGKFDDTARQRVKNGRYYPKNPSVYNLTKSFGTGLTKEQKDILKSCMKKIRWMGDSTLYMVFGFKQFGACSKKDDSDRFRDERYRAIPEFGGI